MQIAKPFSIHPDALATLPEPADRFVPVTHFVPYHLPGLFDDEPIALTPSQVDRAARSAAIIASPDTGKSKGKGKQKAKDDGAGELPDRVRTSMNAWRKRTKGETGQAADPMLQSRLDPADQIAGLLETEFGLLFLDRTRVRPMGFALGEHLTSLSLAPGEEVTIEQRTFTKVERSYEETRDDETTRDLELSSAYSNELTESLDWQVSLNKKSSNTNGAKVSGAYEGIGVEASTQTASDLADGDSRTARDSLKLSETNTRKVASKQRQQHKIVMRLSQESRFETGSKRIIRNTNALAPIDLVYFKIMQRLRVSQERHGVRLCWAPSIGDPGGRLFREIERQRELFMDIATAVDAGPAPVPPTPPTTSPAQTSAINLLADRFDPVWGGQSADYIINIPAPANYTWDRTPVALTFGFSGSRPAGGRVLSAVGTQTGVQVIVHVGVADCRNPLQPAFWEPRGTATLDVGATFIPVPDTAGNQAYTAKFAAFTSEMAQWQAHKLALVEEATRKAEAEWLLRRAVMLSRVDVLQEVMGALIEQTFPRAVRDEPWELDLWQRLFDFDNISVRFYPAWWNSQALRDPTTGASSFNNASWARVYVPIRPGSESDALRWLLSRGTSVSASRVAVAAKKIVDDLRNYRISHFGSESEILVGTAPTGELCAPLTRPYKCLGTWEEVIPTDGTHLEVLQATTSAADDAQARTLALNNDVIEQRVAMAVQDVAIKEGIAADPLTGTTSHVEIRVPETDPE